jgi:hypothetical protein
VNALVVKLNESKRMNTNAMSARFYLSSTAVITDAEIAFLFILTKE